MDSCRVLVCCVVLVAVHWGSVFAQTAPATSAPEVSAKDLREQTVQIEVTVKDMYGREETRRIPLVIYRPQGEGPYPLVVFNHGRAVDAKRATQGRSKPEHLARYLVGKGFVVMAPTRVGYADTYGDFDPEQSGSCANRRIEPMSLAASDQVLATVAFAKSLAYVDTSRWLVVGQSVGGLTAVAAVGRGPTGLVGGINFAGGTGGNPDASPGRPCSPSAIEAYWGKLAKTAQAPMLWLYWENDKYWGSDVPKAWYRAWAGAGAKARFVALAASGEDGHNGLGADMNHWLPEVDGFLAQLGFTQAAIVAVPPPSGFADLADVSPPPLSEPSRTAAYVKFLDTKLPRAFAVGGKSGWGYATGDYAVGRAIGYCQRSGQTCKLYAVDDQVVWTDR